MAVTVCDLELTLDKLGRSPQLVRIRQGDAQSCELRVVVKNGGALAQLSGFSAYLLGSRPDRARVEQEMSASGSNASCVLESKWGGAAGNFRRAFVQIRDASGNVVASTEDFGIHVEPDADIDLGEAGAYKTRLQTLTEQAEKVVTSAVEADGTAKAAAYSAGKSAETAQAGEKAATDSAAAAKLSADSAAKSQASAAESGSRAKENADMASLLAATASAAASSASTDAANASRDAAAISTAYQRYAPLSETLYYAAAAEKERVDAESARAAAEAERAGAERERLNAEVVRVENEKRRQSATGEAEKAAAAASSAAKEAYAAAEEARGAVSPDMKIYLAYDGDYLTLVDAGEEE